MSLKLEELTEDITVVSGSAEQWSTIQNIMQINGGVYSEPLLFKDHFKRTPETIIYTNKQYGNYQAGIGKRHIQVKATDFIAANTPSELAYLTTNDNCPETHSMNL